jgi:prepilin-type N-terminal cleavage/methylation domain-containing protein
MQPRLLSAMSRRSRARQSGFSLVEVVVATALVTLGLSGIYAMQGQTLQVMRSARDSGSASQLLQQRIEDLRMCNYADVTKSAGLVFLMNGSGGKMDSEDELAHLRNLRESVTISTYARAGVTPVPAEQAFTVTRTNGVATASTALDLSAQTQVMVRLGVTWSDRSKSHRREFTTVMSRGGVSPRGISKRPETGGTMRPSTSSDDVVPTAAARAPETQLPVPGAATGGHGPTVATRDPRRAISDMKLSPSRRGSLLGLTIAEVLIAMSASTIVLGGLLVATASLSRTFRATETYSRSQAAQVRLIDSVAIDLRRAVAVSTTFLSPLTFQAGAAPGSRSQMINDQNFLTLRIPGFYRSNTRNDANFRNVTTLLSTGRSVRYGGLAGIAPPVTVQYRKSYLPAFGSQCFIRREAGVDQVIVEKGELIDLDITPEPSNSFTVETWFTAPYSRGATSARVTSSDRVMLRNPRTDL